MVAVRKLAIDDVSHLVHQGLNTALRLRCAGIQCALPLHPSAQDRAEVELAVALWATLQPGATIDRTGSSLLIYVGDLLIATVIEAQP